jgi:general stress protein YciG
MAENKNRNGGKHADEERERDRASEIDQSPEGQARGIRNPFRNERERASETGREGGGH